MNNFTSFNNQNMHNYTYVAFASKSNNVFFLKPAVYGDEKSENNSNSITLARVERLIKNSKTNDLSDILGRYSPKRETVEEFSRKANEFIETCSMDRKHCSFK